MRVVVDGEVAFEWACCARNCLSVSGDRRRSKSWSGAAQPSELFIMDVTLGLMGTFGQVVNNIYPADEIITPTALPSPTIAEHRIAHLYSPANCHTASPTSTPVPSNTPFTLTLPSVASAPPGTAAGAYICLKILFILFHLAVPKILLTQNSMAQLLLRDGYRAVDDPSHANVLIVNTCGFIGPAKEESINVLRELAEGKRNNQILIAAGCLTQRYGSEVAVKVPGIDGVLGTRRWMDIVQVVRELRKGPHPEPLYHLPDEAKTVGTDEHEALRVSVAGASAYIKIADGCRRPCAFCAIPLIKGTAVSRPIDSIVA